MTIHTTPGRAYEHVQRKLTEQERTALSESIKEHGLRDDITLDQHGDILDGYNREDICRELKVPTRYRVLEVDDPVHWINHNQTARRNLGEKEMRDLIVQTKAADPTASTRTIAKKVGTTAMNVSRTLNKAGVTPVTRVKGADGKTYAPKARSRPVEDKAREAIRDNVITGKPVKAREVAKEAGISHVMVEQAAAMERARLDVLKELAVDPTTLSMTAQAKLETVKRQIENRLNAAHAKRMAGVDEEVRLRVLDETKEYLAMLKAREAEAESTVKLYKEWIGNATPIFTEPQYFTILKALDPAIEHRLTKPDPALVKLFNDATVLLNSQRERLTLKKR